MVLANTDNVSISIFESCLKLITPSCDVEVMNNQGGTLVKGLSGGSPRDVSDPPEGVRGLNIAMQCVMQVVPLNACEKQDQTRNRPTHKVDGDKQDSEKRSVGNQATKWGNQQVTPTTVSYWLI